MLAGDLDIPIITEDTDELLSLTHVGGHGKLPIDGHEAARWRS